MFSSSQQSGFISIFYSVGSNPLALWDKQVKNGHIRRVIDDEVKSLVLDIGGTNVATTYITCPIKPRASLGIKLPYFVMVIKNMKKYFSFEIQILDDKDMRRRFRVSNFQSTTKVRPFCTTMPIGLSSGWNQVQFNLADFTKRAYGSVYMETVRVQIHANVRIRRIYFTDQLHTDEELPNEFKLFAPGPKDQKGKGKDKKASKEALETAAGESPVPPIKTEFKPEEEVPPPPSPAEESPVAVIKEEPETTATATPTETEPDLAAEGEGVAAPEVPPPEGTEVDPAQAEEGTEEQPKPEGAVEEPALDPDTPIAETPGTTAEEGLESVVLTHEGASAEEGPKESEEGGSEAPEGDANAEVTGVPVEAQILEEEEPVVETVVAQETIVEQSENVAETTEVFNEVPDNPEVTDMEPSPSEPATTDEGEA